MARIVGSFSSIDEPRSEKMIKISEQSNIWMIWRTLTVVLSCALRPIPVKLLEVTLTGLVSLNTLAWSRVFSYVLPGNFKCDRLEEESRIYWHLSVECY